MEVRLLFITVMLCIFNSLSATNPEKILPTKEPPEHILPYNEEHLSAFMNPSEGLEMLDKFTKNEKIDHSTEMFDFPELEGKLISMTENMMMVNTTTDDMSDVLAVSSTQAEEDAKKIIQEGKTAGTETSELNNLLGINLPAYHIQPLGDNMEAIVVLNSMRLTQDGGKIGVYIGIKVPQKNYDSQGRQKNVTLIFGTEDVVVSAEGAISVKNIFLLNDVAFELGGSKKKSVMKILKGDPDNNTGTYIKFGCSGVEEFGIAAQLHFSKEWLLPADENGVPQPNGNRVMATTGQIIIQDWNDMLVEGLGIERFVMTKYQDMSFKLANVIIDLSDTRNAASFPAFPANYVWPIDVPKSLWRGVYIGGLEITLPEAFKRKCDGYGAMDSLPAFDQELHGKELLAENLPTDQTMNLSSWETDIGSNRSGPNPLEPLYYSPPNTVLTKNTETMAEGCRIKLAAKGMLIDKSGVSGDFSISGQAPIVSGGLMNGKWSWSLNSVGISLVQSNIDGFSFGGGIIIPLAKKETPFAYSAVGNFIDGNDDGDLQDAADVKEFVFTIQPVEKLEFPVFQAFNVSLKPNSSLTVAVTNGDFKPSAVLYGRMSIGKGDPKKDDASLPSIRFENIGLSTESPVITGGGIYLEGGGSKLNNFPVQISGVGFTFNDNGIKLKFTIGLNLMKQSDGGLSASGSFEIFGKRESNVLGADEWKFDKMVFSGVTVKIDLPAVKGCGALSLFKNDDTYGKGFSAFLSMAVMGKDAGTSNVPFVCGATVPGAFNLDMAAIFGSKDGMRYFMIDGYVGSDKISIPLPPTPLAMNGFGGGIFYHMKPTSYKEPNPNANTPAIPAGMDTSGLVYEPDAGTLFGLKFAVGLTTAGSGGDTAPLQGKLSCIVRFAPGLSLQNIMFWGVAEIMNPVEGPPAAPNVNEKVPDLAQTEAKMHQKDMDKAKNMPDKIAGKFGMSFDFESGFSFHAYAEVFIRVAEGTLTGTGSMDLLVDPNPSGPYTNGRWHMFIGGYRDGSVKVPSFFNPEDEIELYPVKVSIDYAGVSVVAEAYFLMGNDIPGPPPLDAEVAEIFGVSTSKNNRDLLYCSAGGNDPAMGTGVAFGASLKVTINKKIRKKIIFKKVTILDIKVKGIAGFDISLLKYNSNTSCGPEADFKSPHGANSFRATGNIYAYVGVSGKVLFLPLGNIGLGLLLRADLPNPSYFNIVAVLEFIKRWRFDLEIGSECGHPIPACAVDN